MLVLMMALDQPRQANPTRILLGLDSVVLLAWAHLMLVVVRLRHTARPDSVHWWLSHQRPVRVGLHCAARCDHHLWGPCSPYGLNLQLDNVDGSNSLPIRWIASRCDNWSTHAIIIIYLTSLLQKVKNGMGSPDWNVENSCGCTALDMPEQ